MKKLVKWLLCALLCVTLLPVSAGAAASTHSHCVCGGTTAVEGHGHSTLTGWSSLSMFDTELPTGGNRYLGQFTVNKPDTTWTIGSGQNVVLCLQDSTLKVKNVVVESGGSLTLTSCTKSTVHSNMGLVCTATEGDGAVVVKNGGTLNLYGTDNARITSEKYGLRAVYVEAGGTFSMYGGAITNHRVDGKGASVYCAGTFNMYGGTISRGVAKSGGGVYIAKGGTFNMSGGKITDNEVLSEVKKGANGAGVCNEGTFTLSGGEISKNTATGLQFTYADDRVSGWRQKAYDSNGGGVYNSGTFNMTGGVITKNTATEDGWQSGYSHGGGVYSSGTFTLTGGEISYNIAAEPRGSNTNLCFGGGVYVAKSGTFIMGTDGGDNEAILILSNQSGSRYGGGCGGGVCNDGSFTLYSGSITENRVNGERTRNHSHGAGVDNMGTFVMNGGIIEKNSTEGNGVDAAEDPWDVWYGGGVDNSGSFTLNDGIIRRNASIRGGGVFNSNKFVMNGGTIENNLAKESGGGVYNYWSDKSISTLNGGTIQNNESKGNGGGVYVAYDGSLTISGALNYGGNKLVITENKAANNGGGVYSEGTLRVYGSEIHKNTAKNGAGVCTTSITTLAGGTEIWNNIATENGGGIYNTGDLTVGVGATYDTIHHNEAKNGGGVYSQGNVTLDDAKISDNTAKKQGGGVYMHSYSNGSSDLHQSKLAVNGDAAVTGNKVTGSTEENNVWVAYDKHAPSLIAANSATFTGTIGVTSERHELGQQVLEGGAVKSVHGRFLSDKAGFVVDETGKLACGHANVTEQSDGTYKCNSCNASDFAAAVTKNGKTTCYTALEQAIAAVSANSTLKLLDDVDYVETLSRNVVYTLDVNGKQAALGLHVTDGTVTITGSSYDSDLSVTVSGGKVKIADGGFGDVTVTGGEATISGGKFAALTVEQSGKATLSGGTFDMVRNDRIAGKVVDLLTAGCAYWDVEHTTKHSIGLASVVANTAVDEEMPTVTLSVTPTAPSAAYGSVNITLTAALNGAPAGSEIEYTWALAGVEGTSNGDTYAFPEALDAGSYTVKCIAACNGQTYAATKTVEVTKAILGAVTAPQAVSDLIYTGEPQALVTGGSTTNGTLLYLQSDGTWATAIPTGTDAGTYTVKWYVDGGENYESSDKKDITVTIAPMEVSIGNVEVSNKEYDGTTAATVKSATFTPVTRAVYSRRAATSIVSADDYIVTSAEFDKAEIGSRTATIDVMLLGKNYTFANSSTTTQTTKSAIITPILLSNAENPLKRYVNKDTTYIYELNSLVSGLTGKQNFSDLNWETLQFTYATGDDTSISYLKDCSISTSGRLTIATKAHSDSLHTGDNDCIGTLTLNATATDLTTGGEGGFKLVIRLYLSDKGIPQRTANLTKTPDPITYGAPLEAITLSDTNNAMKVGTTPVAGTFQWINPTRVPDAGTRWAEWLFTPSDTGAYQTVNGAGAVTISKATPAIYAVGNDASLSSEISFANDANNAFTVTYNGRPFDFTAKHYVYTVGNDTTTGDYVLTEVPGRWLWSKNGIDVTAPVNVSDSGDYTVTFIPNDTVNYNQVTFTVKVTITPKEITPTITAVSRDYERGNVNVTLSGGALTGIEQRDTGKVSIDLRTATGTMADANVGNSKSVTVTGAALVGDAAGNYTLPTNIDTSVNITPKPLTTDMVTLDYTTRLVYNGTAQTITFTVKDGDTELNLDADYTVTAGNSSTNAGNHTLRLTGKGNYGSTIDVNWYIEPKPITADMVTIDDVTYNGSEQTPTITIKDGDTVLEVPYIVLGDGEATDAGIYRLSLTTDAARAARSVGGSNYSLRLSAQWRIVPAELTATATVANKRYDGTTAATVTGVTLKNADGTAITVPYSATANFASAEAGTGKTAYVYVTLLDPNYSFADELATTAVRCTANITGRSGGHGSSGGASGTGVTSAATGDAGIALYGLLTLSAYTGSALLIRGRKKF